MAGSNTLTARVKCTNPDCKHRGTLQTITIPTVGWVVLAPAAYICGHCTMACKVVTPKWLA